MLEEKNKYLEGINSKKRKSSINFLLPIIIILILISIVFFNNLVAMNPKPVEQIIIFIFVILITLFLLIFSLIKNKKNSNDSEINDDLQKIEIINQKINEELNIPSSTIKIDLLATVSKVKNGKVVSKKNIFDAINYEFVIFNQENYIYFFDGAKLYEFEKPMFKTIILSHIKTFVPFWNKKENYNEYKIKRNNLGMFLIKYDQVILNDGFNEYEIKVPTYDLEKLNNLLNIKIEEK